MLESLPDDDPRIDDLCDTAGTELIRAKKLLAKAQKKFDKARKKKPKPKPS